MNGIGRSNLGPCLAPVVGLLGCLLATPGCATSRWVDDHTAGDLWGTGGREMGVSAPPAARDASGDDAPGDEALDALIEVVLTALSIW